MFNEIQWSEEELILLLDLYYSYKYKELNQRFPPIATLCKQLRYINKFNGVIDDEFKISHFRSVDAIVIKARATYQFGDIVQKTKTSKLHKILYAKYNKNLVMLREHCNRIRIKYNLLELPEDEADQKLFESPFDMNYLYLREKQELSMLDKHKGKDVIKGLKNRFDPNKGTLFEK